jgi:hypothetical protein
MTATAARQSTATRTSAQVIPLKPRKRTLDSTDHPEMARILRAALASNMMVEEIKTAVEAAIFENVSRLLTTFRPQGSSAFDAVYLADLTPDPVDHAAVATLDQFAHVHDLSDAIDFADSWDD